MKTLPALMVVYVLLSAIPAPAADVAGDLKAAARKLEEQSSYAWTATPRSDGTGLNWRQGPTEGKTEKGGWTYLTLTLGDAEIAMGFKGEKAAFRRDDEDWQSIEDLEGGDRAWIGRRLKAFKAPAGEAGELAGFARSLKKDEAGVISGELTESGVKELMGRMGRRGADGISGAKGSAKFWTKDGLLTKYEFNLQGSFTRPDNGEEITINRTVTVEIKGVGSTKVEVPDSLRKKLS